MQVEVRRKRAPASQIQRNPSAALQTKANQSPAISPWLTARENQLQDGPWLQNVLIAMVLKQGMKRSEETSNKLGEIKKMQKGLMDKVRILKMTP